MAKYPYGEVEAIEDELDKVLPKLTIEEFTKRRNILAKFIFKHYETKKTKTFHR